MHAVTFISNKDASRRAAGCLAEGDDLLLAAKHKLRLPRATRLFQNGMEIASHCSRAGTVYVSCGEDYRGPSYRHSAPIVIIGSDIDSAAAKSLQKLATMPGVTAVFGMPDLHSGPTGCAVMTAGNCIYPHLAGSDIGCGIALFKCGSSLRFNPNLVIKHVKNLHPLKDADIQSILGVKQLSEDDRLLGSIGAGNHFAEFMAVKDVMDVDALKALGISLTDLLLCVHSGSRHLGKTIFDSFGSDCVSSHSRIEEYMSQHERAIMWAKLNRRTIASRILDDPQPDTVLDITHNSIVCAGTHYIHRKGAAPADMGAVLVPGSRGTFSFLVRPRKCDPTKSGVSIAHGAGRQLSRSQAHSKMVKRHGPDLRGLKDSNVHCSNPQLLAEEVPEAYKDIHGIIEDMSEIVDVIAKLEPLFTIKDFGLGCKVI